ncbi:MAG TPA: nucleotidyltransferase domain-containing protein [Candidatus Ozemobacteraceae bacterium]|nr:nucleotidyltransferase domain-containing protein [Candidatus Ozemobacteraceae bacterium]
MDAEIRIARSYIEGARPAGRILQCGITGSHYYGFPAPDSDLDLKGIHAAPLERVLALDKPEPALNAEGMSGGILCDYTSNEVEQALKLLLKGNGNMLERIYSPFQVFETRELGELRALAPCYLSKRAFHHYKGFFLQVCDEHVKAGACRVKSLLYAYRTALTGVHLLLTGETVGDLSVLISLYGFRQAEELIHIYGSSTEKKSLSPEDDAKHRGQWPVLLERLTAAFEASCLPDEPKDPGACSDWLVDLRLRVEEGGRAG